MVRQEYSDGVYEGEFKGKNREGYGKYEYNSGRVKEYSGYWKNNRYHGMGKLILSNGRAFSGLFVNNCYIGKVKKIDEKGDMQPLSSVEEYPEGTVSIVWPDAKGNFNEYRGQWYYGARHGYGVQNYGSKKAPDEGFFFKDKFIAKDITSIETGERIKFVNGSFQGKVKVEYANGETYEGDWENGYRNGCGCYRYSNKDFYRGYWKYGERWTNTNIGQESVYHSFGTKTTYVGEFDHDIFNGRGKLLKDDSTDYYEGFFSDGVKNGYGTAFIKNIGTLKMSWLSGKRHGLHEYNFDMCPGTHFIFEGEYSNDKLKAARIYNDNYSIDCIVSYDNIGICHIDLDQHSTKIKKDQSFNNLILSFIDILSTGIIAQIDEKTTDKLLMVALTDKLSKTKKPKTPSTMWNVKDCFSTPDVSRSCYETRRYQDQYANNTHDSIILERGCDSTSYLIWD